MFVFVCVCVGGVLTQCACVRACVRASIRDNHAINLHTQAAFVTTIVSLLPSCPRASCIMYMQLLSRQFSVDEVGTLCRSGIGSSR